MRSFTSGLVAIRQDGDRVLGKLPTGLVTTVHDMINPDRGTAPHVQLLPFSGPGKSACAELRRSVYRDARLIGRCNLDSDATLIGIVVVTNGRVGKEMLASIEQIAGPQPDVAAISVGNDDGRMTRDEICQAIDRVDSGEGVIVLTDIKGSSPSNICENACSGADRVIISGVNMPMLLKLMKYRKKSLQIAAQAIVEAGRFHINLIRCN